IGELRELLGDEEKVFGLIKEEMLEISERFANERRTMITFAEDELDIEDLIADQQMVITITKSGYIKRLPLDTYRAQHRGGRGAGWSRRPSSGPTTRRSRPTASSPSTSATTTSSSRCGGRAATTRC